MLAPGAAITLIALDLTYTTARALIALFKRALGESPARPEPTTGIGHGLTIPRPTDRGTASGRIGCTAWSDAGPWTPDRHPDAPAICSSRSECVDFDVGYREGLSYHGTVRPLRSRYSRPGLPRFESSTLTMSGMASSRLYGASGPPSAVRIQPGASSSKARACPACRAA